MEDKHKQRAMDDQYLTIGVQYYVVARSASFGYLIPVAGNLFHHAIEMFLKFLLLKYYSPGWLWREFMHDLKKLWKEYKSRTNDASLAQYDDLISSLDKIEELRYPKKGYQFFIDFRKEYYSHSKGPIMKGMKEYRLNLEQIDQFVKELLMNRVNPDWIKNLLFHGDAKAQYEKDNLHIIYKQ